MALPMCLRSPAENLLAQAQSGSGKTAAFCLASLARVDTRVPMPQVGMSAHTRNERYLLLVLVLVAVVVDVVVMREIQATLLIWK